MCIRDRTEWSPSPNVADFQYDLAVFDEAHKTALVGKKKDKKKDKALFQHALFDDTASKGGVPIQRRLFMTATPRHAPVRTATMRGNRRGGNGKGDDDDDDGKAVMSMDDVSVYGPRVPGLPGFREAMDMGLICEYKLVVIRVRADVLKKSGLSVRNLAHGTVDGDTGDAADSEIGALGAAKVLALRHAVQHATNLDGEPCPAKKIFTFHSFVSQERSRGSHGKEVVPAMQMKLSLIHI